MYFYWMVALKAKIDLIILLIELNIYEKVFILQYHKISHTQTLFFSLILYECREGTHFSLKYQSQAYKLLHNCYTIYKLVTNAA